MLSDWFEVGYAGLFFACFLAATIIPFSSDALVVVMAASGYDPFLTITIATIGNTLGGLSSYGVGRLGRWDLIEKYFRIPKTKIEKMRDRVRKFTGLAAFLTWLPAIGDAIAVTLGLLKINIWRVILFMTLGKLARYIVLVYLWYVFF